MAVTGTLFQRSNQVKLDRTIQETWTTELGVVSTTLMDSLGVRSRVLQVKITNPTNLMESSYFPMQRVRLLDDWGLVTFLGRVVSIEPDHPNRQVVLTCRDFLDDLADRTVEAPPTGAENGATYSRIIDLIHDDTTTTPTFRGQERSLAGILRVTNSSYREYLYRQYAIKGDWKTVTGSVVSEYDYRGVKTGLEALNEIAEDDTQQDLMVLYYTYDPVDHAGASYSEKTRPSTYWTDFTREATTSGSWWTTMDFAEDTTTPQSTDISYFGSNSKFDGLIFEVYTQGTTIYDATYDGTLQWQYWNGTAWTGFTPASDSKFEVISGTQEAKTTWTVSNLTTWTKRDLGTTPDMHTDNDADESWSAPWTSSGNTQPEDIRSTSLAKVDHGDEQRGTNRYWIRVYVRTGSTARGYFTKVRFPTYPQLSHDFRCDDPEPFSEVWKYTHNAAGSGWTVGREGHGGTWLSLNMTGGNDGSGSRLLWDANDNTTNFIGGATDTWYFGSEKPFNGVSFHAFQDTIPDYSNVKFVWQWYSNYFSNSVSPAEPWQTISGLTISANTVANPTVITTERHWMATGDTCIISGSNSTPSINGTHTITRISNTTFSIPVNVTTAGTAGHVVCNNLITATEAMSGSGNAGWQQDVEQIDTSNHWYLDVRWNHESNLATVANEVAVSEFDTIRILNEFPYRDLVSLDTSPAIKNGPAATGLNSATVANPTVITSSATAGGTTANHNMKTGDQVSIYGSNSTPSIDGIHTVTVISATTFSIPITVTSAGNTGTVQAFTTAPNEKYLYWVRCFITTGTPTTVATLRDVKTANVGMLSYFDRGSGPWKTNTPTTVNGSLANTVLPYCYRYDTSASAGSKFTDFSQEIQSSISGATDLRVISNTLANPTVVTTNGPSFTISGNTVASPTVVTTTAAHGLATDDVVVITNSNSTPSINGTFEVTVVSTTTFSIDINITSAGSQGTVVPTVLHGLTTGHKVVITNSNSTPSINGTHTVTVLSTTTFSIAINVTTAGTAGTVVPEKVYAIDNGQAGDAIYFGNDEPFTQLRLNVSDVLSSSSSGLSAITWEYYKGESTDNWTSLTSTDKTFDFKVSGTNTIIFDMPVAWRTIQPGIKEANATDQSFGKTAYYVRARLAATSGSPATSAAKIVQGWFGPNLWHPNLEAGTVSGITSKRHSDPKTYGLTLTELTGRGSQRMPISAYEIKDHATDFVNKVSVRGQKGAYGVAEDTDSQTTYGLVKERIYDDSTLQLSQQCQQRAFTILERLKPGTSSTIRECRIRIPAVAIYSYLNEPALVRAGDRVNVNIPTAEIANESWLVYSIMCNVSDDGWSCDLMLFQDMTKVFEPGPTDRKVIRDLVSRTREVANAAFQPIDKAVQSTLDFLPQGPGRSALRMSYDPVGTELGVDPQGGGADANYVNEFRLNFGHYANHDASTVYIDPLMRIDSMGLPAERNGIAMGGAGLTFIGRRSDTNGTPDFHPGIDEATVYLRESSTLSEGNGLYIAHRDVFNSGATYDEWVTDTPKLNAEVMTGFTGFVSGADLDATAKFTINLPNLDSAPLIFTTICGHEGISGTPSNWTNATANVYRWTVGTSGVSTDKYTAVEMQVINYPNSLVTGVGYFTITAISAASPTVITTTANVPNGRAVWIGETNSTPSIDGLYNVSNKAGSSPYTYTLNSFNTSVFPVNVTSAGTEGKIYSMANGRYFSQAQIYDWPSIVDAQTLGVMYMVVFNSGKNTTGLNSHFSQNHVNHG